MSSKYYYWEYGQTAAAIFIFTMIVVGNISILNKLKSCSRRRSNVNYFIVQLAIADLLVGLFSVSLDTVLRLQKSFTYGLMACRISKYIQVSTRRLTHKMGVEEEVEEREGERESDSKVLIECV